MGAEPTQFGSTSCASLKDTWVMGGFIIEYRSTLCYVVSRRVTLNCSAVDDTYNELIIVLIIASHRIVSHYSTILLAQIHVTSPQQKWRGDSTACMTVILYSSAQWCTTVLHTLATIISRSLLCRDDSAHIRRLLSTWYCYQSRAESSTVHYFRHAGGGACVQTHKDTR